MSQIRNIRFHLWLGFGFCLSWRFLWRQTLNVTFKHADNSTHIVSDCMLLCVLTSFNLRDLLLGCREREQRGWLLFSADGSQRRAVTDPWWVPGLTVLLFLNWKKTQILQTEKKKRKCEQGLLLTMSPWESVCRGTKERQIRLWNLSASCCGYDDWEGVLYGL